MEQAAAQTICIATVAPVWGSHSSTPLPMRSNFPLRILCALLLAAGIVCADEYDTLRQKWSDTITGGSAYNTADPTTAAAITGVTSAANGYWTTMDKSVSRTFLWSDAASTTVSADLSTNFSRLRAMARAYATTGSTLQGNATLLADIIGGLDWMYANRYNETKAIYDNWFDFEIGSPLALVDATTLLYSQLTAAQIANYMNAVNKFTPSATTPAAGGTTGTFTGANRMWKIDVVAVRGIIVKDSAKLTAARDAFSNLFVYVTGGDGFYTDGSFIQHTKNPYNGSYGAGLLGTMAPVLSLLSGSTWAVTDPNQSNLIQWVYDSYEPLIYRGGMMAMVSGRDVSRYSSSEHGTGQSVMQSILRISQFAPAADAARMRAMVKYWAQTDSSRNFVGTAPLSLIPAVEQLMADASVTPRGELTGNFIFADMDRVVHLRPGFGLGLSMSSSRIYNYESINSENLHGWYQGDGVTYLYNGDLAHYSDAYWPTVNPRRLPGTTVDSQQPRADGSGQSTAPAFNWVGGASFAGNGVAGMQLDGWSNTLTAKKSWFMFDNELVCLGAGITSTDARTIETTVENRLLGTAGSEVFTVNGVAKSRALGWSETMSGVNWAHLAGRVSGADIGCYFPSATTVKGLRETRTGAWSDINAGGTTTANTRNYLTLWFDHGASPANASYAYVLLPGRPATMVADYAAHPQISVVENSTSAQCVQEILLGVTAANFWNDASYTSGGITVDKKASVLVQGTGGFTDVAISDPTQANTGSIAVTVAAAAGAMVSADAGITLTQLTPTIRFTVNVAAASGRTFHARFFTGATQTVAVSPVADAYVYDAAASADSNFGTATTLVVKKSGTGFNRESYLRFSVPAWSGVLLGTALKLTPLSTSTPGVHGVAPVSDNTWIESGAGGITWNNKPASGAVISTWTPAVGTNVSADVSSAVTASGLVSFRVYGTTQTADGYVTYGSKENATAANRPQLVMTMGHTPPTVAITSPADGTLFNRVGSVTLTVAAAGTDGSVSSVAFYDGATLLGTDGTAPYIFTIANLSGGNHRFTAIATDSNGLSTTSLPVVVNVPFPPTAVAVSVTTPKNTAIDVNLLTLASDVETPAAQLRFMLGSAVNGSVTLLADGHTAHFVPAAGYSGAATFAYTVADTTPDPRAFLNCNFQSSDATDITGNGRDGTLNVQGTGSATFTADVPAALAPQQTQSLHLIENGTAGAARVEANVPATDLNFLTSDWSITGWFKRTGTANIDSVFQLGESGGWGSDALSLVCPSGSTTVELRNYSGATQDVSIIKTGVTIGAWHHFAIVRSGTTISLYVDGTLVGSDTGFAFTFDNGKPVKFGGVAPATSNTLWDRWFNGSLADPAIFNGALSGAEIAKLITMPTANFSGQIAGNTVGLIVLSSLESWRQQYFGTTANAGIAADGAMPQNDGVGNLLKFATGLDPTAHGLMPGTVTPNGSNVNFTYTPSATAVADGVTFTVEYSDTLGAGSWKSDIVNQGAIGAGGTPVTATVPKGSGGRRFLHLKVTRP